MSGEKRRSNRVVPILSDEEVIMIDVPRSGQVLAKILDISEHGVLGYIVESEVKVESGMLARAGFYQKGRVFHVRVRLLRKTGRMIGIEFVDSTPGTATQIRAKIASLESAFMKPKAT